MRLDDRLGRPAGRPVLQGSKQRLFKHVGPRFRLVIERLHQIQFAPFFGLLQKRVNFVAE